MSETHNKKPLEKPEWLRKRLPLDATVMGVGTGLRKRNLHTICEEGLCPNMGECFSKNVATLLIMGKNCTRNCSFCGVSAAKPLPLDIDEPEKVAEEVSELGLKFVVVTSVTRDDLNDGGAEHFARVTEAIKERCPGVGVELLIPDFGGSTDLLDIVLHAEPHILSHNMETAESLYMSVRPQADYKRSLGIIEYTAKIKTALVKSGFMLGLGETFDEMRKVMKDLHDAGCQMITIGQYLCPSPLHYPVQEYIHPDIFKEYEAEAKAIGFLSVASGPFVRSSYLAEKFYNELLEQIK
ncbi:lipoyl synthase [Spirochaetota bacterium]